MIARLTADVPRRSLLLLAALFIGGVWPSSYLRYIQPSVEAMVGK